MPSAGKPLPEGVVIDGDPARDGAITIATISTDKNTIEIRDYDYDALCDDWVSNPEAGVELPRQAWDRLVAAVDAHDATRRCFKVRFGDEKRCMLRQGHVEFHKYE